MCLKKFIKHYSFIVLLLILTSMLHVVVASTYSYKQVSRGQATTPDIPNMVLVARGYIKGGDLVRLADVIRDAVFGSLNISMYSGKPRIRVIKADWDRSDLLESMSHNFYVFKYVNWTALKGIIPLVNDSRFEELLGMGYFWVGGFFTSIDDVVRWNTSQRYVERGRYNYTYNGISLRNRAYEIFINPVLPDVFWILISIDGYRNISKYIDDYELAQAIANKIYSWYIGELAKLGLNKSVRKIVIPNGKPYELDLVNLTPPLPDIYLLITLGNGSKYLLEIKGTKLAQVIKGYGSKWAMKKPHCLIVLVNNSSCLLHIRISGIEYYLATGVWDPSKVFYKDEYKRYLKLISNLGTVKAKLPRDLKRDLYYPYAMIRSVENLLFFVDVDIDRELETIHINLFLPLTVVSIARLNIPRSLDINTLFNYLNTSCPIVSEYLYGTPLNASGFLYIPYNIDVLKELWHLVDELNRTYTDNLSRKLLSYVLKIMLNNEKLDKVRQTHKVIISLGESILKKMLGRESDNIYYVFIPEYYVSIRGGEALLVYIHGLHLSTCIVYSRVESEFWEFINSVNPRALIKPLSELEKKMSNVNRGIESMEATSLPSPYHGKGAVLTITLPPRTASTSSTISTTSLATSTVSIKENTTSRINYTVGKGVESERSLTSTTGLATSIINTTSIVNTGFNLTTSLTSTTSSSTPASKAKLPNMPSILLMLTALVLVLSAIIALKRYRK